MNTTREIRIDLNGLLNHSDVRLPDGALDEFSLSNVLLLMGSDKTVNPYGLSITNPAGPSFGHIMTPAAAKTVARQVHALAREEGASRKVLIVSVDPDGKLLNSRIEERQEVTPERDVGMFSQVSVLTNTFESESGDAPVQKFLEAKGILNREVTRVIKDEPEKMYWTEIPGKLTFRALEAGLHVDKCEGTRVIVFTDDYRKLSAFIGDGKAGLPNILEIPGVKVVKYTCRRLSRRDELLAIKAGALVGRLGQNAL